MEGLTIRKKVTPRANNSPGWFTNSIGLAVLAVIALLAIPFLLIALLIGMLTDVLDRTGEQALNTANKLQIRTPFLIIYYEYIWGGDISEAAREYFDDELLLRYKTEPSISFFEGYFSDFKIERTGGIFVQKVNFNAALTGIVAMPLYFFNYATKEAEEIYDFKDYALDTRGGPNNFKIIASSLEDDGEDLEIEIAISSSIL